MIDLWKKLLKSICSESTYYFSELTNKLVGDFKDLKTKSALVLLPYSVIKISGIDANKFLQGQLSCEVDEINQEEISFGAYCNIKGRVLAFFKTFKIKDDYFLLFPTELLLVVQQELKKYGAFSKVEISNLERFVIGLIGKERDLKNIIVKNFPEISTTNSPNKVTFTKEMQIIINQNFIDSEHSALQIIVTAKTAKSMLKNLTANEFIAHHNLWELFSVKSLSPEIYSSTCEQILPHHINLPEIGAVSFNKGCYRGQEVIARMQHLGKIKRKLYLCTAQNAPTSYPIGAKIYSNSTNIGTIIRCAFDETKKLYCLIEIQKDKLTEQCYFTYQQQEYLLKLE